VSELTRAVLIASLIVSGALVVRGTFGTDRYDLLPGPQGTVYRIDRLGGQVAYCTPVACRVLPFVALKVGPSTGTQPPAGTKPADSPPRAPGAST
jgi:hypothetical protein